MVIRFIQKTTAVCALALMPVFAIAQTPAESTSTQPATVQSSAANQIITRDTFRNVARKVSPAVVNIKIKSNIVFANKGNGSRAQIPPSFGLDEEMREYLEQLFEKQMPYLTPGDQEEYKYARSGSGVIISPDGYVVTSNHVVSGVKAEDIEISLPDGRVFDKVSISGTDDLTDLAVLKAEEANGLPAVSWGDSDKLEVGDHVVAIGNPLEFNNSVSEGIVSAKHRVIKKAPIEDLIQTTAMINPGNSGGALVDLDGQLIGINMAIATSTGMWSGLGFAIPSKTARDVTDQIIAKGKVARGFLGIDMSPLTANLAHQLGYNENMGIVVKDVKPGTAADAAGIQRYDIIARVEGKEIKEINDMHRNIGGRPAGESVELEIYRDEGANNLQRKVVKVQLGERPSQSEIEQRMREPDLPGKKAEPTGLIGLKLVPAPGGKGVAVEDVEPNSRAALAQIQKGDVIMQINKQDVSSREDAQKALNLRKEDSHLFFIERGNTSQFVTVPAE